MALSTKSFLDVRPISSSPSTSPVFTVHRVVKDAADAGDITNSALGMNMFGFRTGVIRVIPSVSANPNIEVQFWSEEAGKFVSRVPAVTANGIGAGLGYDLSFKAFGGLAFVRVTGGVAGGDTVTITVAGAERRLVVEAIPLGFKTEWSVAGDAAARTITLPLVQSRAEGALSYNCIVDWGDGTTPSVVTSYNDANRIHTYALDGTYEVEITGTMEGWSFNNAGDKLKITDIINWGDLAVFDGFKYLKAGFYGCTNLASLGTGSIIPASGAGLGTDGFYDTFRACTTLTTVPTDLFRYNTAVTSNAFRQTFELCTALTTVPTDTFRYNTLVSIYGFYRTFYGCTSFTTIPADLFRYNTAVTTSGFIGTFRGTSITTIPTDLFRYNTLVSGAALQETFHSCTSLATVPTDLFRYNTVVTGFTGTFQGCTVLATVPTDLFRYNTAVTGFNYTFYGCIKLQQNANIFYQAGAQATRFLNIASNFTSCFDRASFTGTQGTAPDLWECDFGEVITLDVSPATDWDPGDIITGQTSGVTSEVVSKVDATHYKIKKHVGGAYTLDEIIGVTGVPAKLADQGAAHPTTAGGPTMTDCWEGAGNSPTSLDNYASIPADWI